MNEIPITLHSSQCLITGYGRIGKVLAKMLTGIGAKVTVAARRCEVLAQAQADGCEACYIKDLPKTLHNYEVIFNTIPAMIFDEKLLRSMSKDALLIDLASKPGGIDFETAKKLNLRVIWALSLPGKVAPVTSGAIIKETIMNILNELGV